MLHFASKRTNDSIEFLVNNTVSQTKNYQKATSDVVKTPMQEEVWEMIKDMFLEEERPMIILDPLGGKLEEISEFEHSFPHTKGNLFNIQYMVNWGDNSESISIKKIKWLRELYEKIKPFLSHCPRTAYLNYRDLGFGPNDGVYSYSKAKVWGAKYFKTLRGLLR
ncbi:berberine bridge enzyme-like 22 [Nicotiana tomentosiformis]|uniref:berberine bridge enzyme-like 22 n=1 Tax=Nicotiana tomentosiformis TaxID=4098 RepID=UPI00388CDA76